MKIKLLLTLFIWILFPLGSMVVNAADLKVENRDQAVQLVKQQYQGKVLKVQSSQVNQDPSYQVKLLSEKGVIFYLQVDALTGRVSKE